MEIIEILKYKQPEIIPKLQMIKDNTYCLYEDDYHTTFDYYNKMMREVPRKG